MKPLQLDNLKIPVPIVQGGMGVGISLSGLASAVANMGGIGVISSAAIGLTNHNRAKNYRKQNIESLRNEIRQARSMTNGVLGVNIMTVLTDFSDMVKTSIEEGIDIIFSGAGLPMDLPKYLGNNRKTKLVPIVSSARAAKIVSTKWIQNYNYLPDAFVVEGPKAGGHLGFKENMIRNAENNLENLVEEVMKIADNLEQKYRKKIPVIAAGGIYSGDDMCRFIQQGVSAVQLGTRFVATEECDASPKFKNEFVKAEEKDISIIKSPVGMPGRVIYNNFLKEATQGLRKPAVCPFHCIKTCDPKTTLYCIADALLAAYEGRMNDGFAFAGSTAAKVKKISNVRQVFAELKAEYAKAKKTVLT